MCKILQIFKFYMYEDCTLTRTLFIRAMWIQCTGSLKSLDALRRELKRQRNDRCCELITQRIIVWPSAVCVEPRETISPIL